MLLSSHTSHFKINMLPYFPQDKTRCNCNIFVKQHHGLDDVPSKMKIIHLNTKKVFILKILFAV